MNANKILSILITLLILAGGGTGYYFLNEHYKKIEVNSVSELVSKTPSTTVTKAVTADVKDKNADLKTIIHGNQKKVVQLNVETSQGLVEGSGFLYNDKGDIITNAHVVLGAQKITVQTADAEKYPGVLIGKGDTLDVAVVRVADLANKEPVKIATQKSEIGDEVLALGSPLGLQNTVTTGIISGVNRDLTIDPFVYKNLYQISAPITHGNSGGPLLNQKTGEVVGINSAGADSGTIGFSIPITDVYNQVKNWSLHPQKYKVTSNETNSSVAGTDTDTGMDFQTEAEYLVNYYYESIDSSDYVTAYALLGSPLQSKTDYKKFREGFRKTIGATITDMQSLVEGKKVKVTVIIEAVERKNGKNTKSTYQCHYTIGYEDEQIKILEASAKKM